MLVLAMLAVQLAATLFLCLILLLLRLLLLLFLLLLTCRQCRHRQRAVDENTHREGTRVVGIKEAIAVSA